MDFKMKKKTKKMDFKMKKKTKNGFQNEKKTKKMDFKMNFINYNYIPHFRTSVMD